MEKLENEFDIVGHTQVRVGLPEFVNPTLPLWKCQNSFRHIFVETSNKFFKIVSDVYLKEKLSFSSR